MEANKHGLTPEQIRRYNSKTMHLISLYLNLLPDIITPDAIEELVRDADVTREYAYALMMASVCGLDIAGLAGVFLGGAAHHVPVLIDGAISGAAALIAARLCPDAKDYMLASHTSDEPCGDLILAELRIPPFIKAGMHLGEGTGAVAAMPLLDMALAVYSEMPTFDEIAIEAYQPLK